MTLEELKTRCDNAGLQYLYGTYDVANIEVLNPPYLIAHTNSSNNFVADMVVYKKISTIQLDYYYIVKDEYTQAIIENNILYDVAWDKDEETYLDGEEIWQVSYYFEVVG